jgi:hypothetical protein
VGRQCEGPREDDAVLRCRIEVRVQPSKPRQTCTSSCLTNDMGQGRRG